MKIKVFDYTNEYKEHEIPDEVTHLVVEVVTGDEIITPYINDKALKTIDGGEGSGRIIDFYDGIYTVKRDGIEEWNERTRSYQFFRLSEVK